MLELKKNEFGNAETLTNYIHGHGNTEECLAKPDFKTPLITFTVYSFYSMDMPYAYEPSCYLKQ